MTATIARRRLAATPTGTLIAQYDLAIASHAGRYTDHAPRQKRIDYIVGLLETRADDGDPVSLAWFANA